MSSIRHSPRSLASRWKGTICTPLQNHHRPPVQSDRGNCMTICLVPIADTLIFGGYSWYPIVSMIIGATLIAIARVRHATLLHLWFQFLLCCSSWLKTLLTQLSSHTSGLLSTQTEFSHYSHTAGSMCPFVNSKPYRACGIISSIAIYSATRGILMN